MVKYKHLWLFGLLLLVIACSTSKPDVNSIDKEKTNLFKEEIEAGEMGKADFITGELVNIDQWPFPLNKEEVFSNEIGGNPYEYGTCSHFIDQRNKYYRMISQFVINEQGTPENISFLNNVGPCEKPFLELFKELKFTPVAKDSSYLPTLVIYPLDFSYAYDRIK